MKRCAASRPRDGRPRRSETTATIGTARSRASVSTASTPWLRASVLDRGGVTDIRDLRHVGVAEALGLRIVVDRDDTMAEAAHVDDRGALVAARADEKDSGHGAMLDEAFPQPGGIADGLDYHPGVALTGKRIAITGGAGFIGTTLARRLVDENEVIAVDNLHRDALSGHELAAHPNFRLAQGDVLDPERLTELFAGCTHVVHAAGIAGVDTVLSSPVRTMRVNVIGTYNALEAALATKDTVERIVEFSTSEVFGQYAFNVQEAHVTSIGSVGEARWTYAVSKLAGRAHGARLPRELGLPSVSVRPFNIYGPGQIGGGAIRAFIEAALGGRRPRDPRRRLADPRVVLRRRHGRGGAPRARAPGRGRRELQRRQPALAR